MRANRKKPAAKRAYASIKELREEIEQLRLIGSQMANVFFNWSQHHQIVTPEDRELMHRLYKQWDAIPRRSKRPSSTPEKNVK